MSTNYSTTNQSYKHLSEAERGEIEAYLSLGLKPAEIARRLGENRSTITRKINRGSITQVKKVNGQKVYYQHYYADAAHNRYRHAREDSYYLKLDSVLDDFLRAFTEAMREKPRVHSVDTFVHTYRLQHVDTVVPSTKTLYNYIHQVLLEIKVIDLPRAVWIRKKFTKRPSTKKHLGKSIEERPEEINNRFRFGDWANRFCSGWKDNRRAFYSGLGRTTSTLCCHKETRGKESRVCQSSGLRVCETLSH